MGSGSFPVTGSGVRSTGPYSQRIS